MGMLRASDAVEHYLAKSTQKDEIGILSFYMKGLKQWKDYSEVHGVSWCWILEWYIDRKEYISNSTMVSSQPLDSSVTNNDELLPQEELVVSILFILEYQYQYLSYQVMTTMLDPLEFNEL